MNLLVSIERPRGVRQNVKQRKGGNEKRLRCSQDCLSIGKSLGHFLVRSSVWIGKDMCPPKVSAAGASTG